MATLREQGRSTQSIGVSKIRPGRNPVVIVETGPLGLSGGHCRPVERVGTEYRSDWTVRDLAMRLGRLQGGWKGIESTKDRQFRRSLLKFFYSGIGDLCVADVEVAEIAHLLQMLQTSVGHLCAAEVKAGVIGQHFPRTNPASVTCVSSRLSRVRFGKRRQMDETDTGDPSAAEVEPLEVSKSVLRWTRPASVTRVPPRSSHSRFLSLLKCASPSSVILV